MELLDVVRAMTKLPPHQRDAIVMVAAHGMSHEKAASISLCAVGTIKSRVSRARKALQGAIDIGTRPTRGAHPAMSLAAFAAAQHAGSATSAGPQLL
jgi:RNA polymerase sigma-70 factor (ECF subfamily)